MMSLRGCRYVLANLFFYATLWFSLRCTSNLLLFWQLSEELTGYPPTNKTMIEEESLWIHSHLTGDGFLSFFGNERMNKFDQKDIVNVVTMLHVNKFEVCKIMQICFSMLCLLVWLSFCSLSDSVHCNVQKRELSNPIKKPRFWWG